MFPLNLQRNIVQLDRQISLLENECKNMEMEKKKKSQRVEPAYTSCSKSATARVKAPTVRVTVKQTENMKRSKKPTPPASSRLQSTGSLPSHCGKSWCENDGGRKSRFTGLNSKPPVYSCQTLLSPQGNSRRENKCSKCLCYNELSVSDAGNDESFDGTKRDHVLLFPNSGGTIEVTVTQKPNNGKENSPNGHKSPVRKSINLDKETDRDFDGCKCQIKGQKWSEILCVDASKKRHSCSGKNKLVSDDTKVIYQPLGFTNNNKQAENSVVESQDNSHSSIREETFDIPIKLPSQSCKMKNQTEINSNKYEKETQCTLENSNWAETNKELKDPVKIFELLVNQFQQMSGKGSKSSIETDTFTKVEERNKDESDLNKNDLNSSSTPEKNAACLNAVKHHCESLIKEKSLLTEELASKDNMIATMRKREEEYLSLIASLKSSLEKTKERAKEGIEAVKQISIVKSKLLDQMKVSEALRKRLDKLQDDSTQYNLENSKLRTQIKIFQLEAQKYEIVLAGKEAEISRYREEIQNFQRQIEEHLTSLKSNAQVVDIEKMIEAIMQQSQVFAQTDLDSVIEKDEKDSSKLQNVLMHSSPTSTKTSVVNSSWKQISSIHEHDQSKANSGVIYLNDDGNEKNFFEVFGGNPEGGPPKKTKEPSVEKLSEKRAPSFRSCVSLHGDPNLSRSSSRDSLISKESLGSAEEAAADDEEETKKGSGVSLDKAQSNIEQLLKNMKLKFSKEIFETTLPSCTTEDYLDISQISSISPL